MTRPWMPLYVADYLADTGHLGTLEHGAYLLLIMHYWQNGKLPTDDAQLARICRMSKSGWNSVRETMAALFDENWRHKRVEEELTRATNIISARSGSGKAGAESRWGKVSSKTRSERLADARQIAQHTPSEWLAMLAIFDGCVKCGELQSDLIGGKCVKDHIVPLYQGGSDGLENIQPMCRNCNSAKGGDTTDYRDKALPDWRKRLTKRLANGSPSPVHTPTEGSNSSTSENSGLFPPERKKYAFEFGVVKLTKHDLEQWESAFPHVSVKSELMAAEPWLAREKNWFQAAAGLLAKRQREATKTGPPEQAVGHRSL